MKLPSAEATCHQCCVNGPNSLSPFENDIRGLQFLIVVLFDLAMPRQVGDDGR